MPFEENEGPKVTSFEDKGSPTEGELPGNYHLVLGLMVYSYIRIVVHHKHDLLHVYSHLHNLIRPVEVSVMFLLSSYSCL